MDRKYDNNTWVYYNGELYHAGVKGMHWYQHLPGTDWWKTVGTTVKNVYKSNMQKNSPFAYDSKKGAVVQQKSPIGVAKSAFAAAKTGARMIRDKTRGYFRRESMYYGNKLKNTKAYQATSKYWNTAKGYAQDQINKYRESARQAYQNKRTEINKALDAYNGTFKNKKGLITGKSGFNDLIFLFKQDGGLYQGALNAYTNANMKGTFGSKINSFIQTGKYNTVAACAKYLDSIALDDEVAKLLRKFMK